MENLLELIFLRRCLAETRLFLQNYYHLFTRVNAPLYDYGEHRTW